MKAFFIISIFMLVVVQISPASAWTVTNHHEIAEDIYSAMPPDVRANLSLDEMKNGADDPDTVFFDFKYHVYPLNLLKADYWLKAGKLSYESGNYRYASYCYGVASHYIADGLCGPHQSRSSRYLHTLYEIRATFLEPEIIEISGDPYYHNRNLWDMWVREGNDLYIQDSLDTACTISYLEVMESIES